MLYSGELKDGESVQSPTQGSHATEDVVALTLQMVASHRAQMISECKIDSHLQELLEERER